MSTKTCNACKQLKPLAAYNKHPRTKSGLQGHCRDCGKARSTNWRNENLERQQANEKAWKQANPQRVKEQKQRRQEALAGLHSDYQPFSRKAVRRVWSWCLACGSTERLTTDHIYPIGHPRCTNTLGNFQTLCAACNTRKGKQVIDYRRTSDGRLVLHGMTWAEAEAAVSGGGG